MSSCTGERFRCDGGGRVSGEGWRSRDCSKGKVSMMCWNVCVWCKDIIMKRSN